MRKKRIFLWVFLAIQVLFVAWIISASVSAAHDIHSCHGLYKNACLSGSETGTTIGFGLLIFFWAAVDTILGISYGIYKLSHR